MKGKMLVARLRCGCVAGAYFEDDEDNPKDLGTAVLDWLRKGYVVKYEERDSICAEKCQVHEVKP